MTQNTKRRLRVIAGAAVLLALALAALAVLCLPPAGAAMRTHALNRAAGSLPLAQGRTLEQTLTLTGTCRGFAVWVEAPAGGRLRAELLQGDEVLAHAAAELSPAAEMRRSALVLDSCIACGEGRTLRLRLTWEGPAAALGAGGAPADGALYDASEGAPARALAANIRLAQIDAVAADGQGLLTWCILIAVLAALTLAAGCRLYAGHGRTAGGFFLAAVCGGLLFAAVLPPPATPVEAVGWRQLCAAGAATPLPDDWPAAGTDAAPGTALTYRRCGEALARPRTALTAPDAPADADAANTATAADTLYATPLWMLFPALGGAAAARLAGLNALWQLLAARLAGILVYAALGALAIAAAPTGRRALLTAGLLPPCLLAGTLIGAAGWLLGAAWLLFAGVLSVSCRPVRAKAGQWVLPAAAAAALTAAMLWRLEAALPLMAAALVPARRLCPLRLWEDAPAARRRARGLPFGACPAALAAALARALCVALGLLAAWMGLRLALQPHLAPLRQWVRWMSVNDGPLDGRAALWTLPLWTLLLAGGCLRAPLALRPSKWQRTVCFALFAVCAAGTAVGVWSPLPVLAALPMALWAAAPRGVCLATPPSARPGGGQLLGCCAATVATALTQAAAALLA